MKPEERRALMRKESEERHKESYDSRDAGGKYKSIWKSGTADKFWKCSNDDHEIYTVPWISGENHPKVGPNHLSIAINDLWTHGKIGPNENSYICMNKTYGKKCAVCLRQEEMIEDGEFTEKEINALNASRRSVFNIICMDSNKELKKGPQLWEVSHYLFTKEVDELSQKKKGGGKIQWGDPDVGKIISFRKKGQKLSTEYTAIEFMDRDPIDDDILDKAIVIEELLVIPDFEEVDREVRLSKRKKDDEEEEGDQPKKKKKHHDDDDDDPPPKKKKVVKEEDDDPPPKKKKAPVEDDDDPPPRKKKVVEEDVKGNDTVPTSCGYGAVFGKDYLEYEECETCVDKSFCKAKKKELESEDAPTPKKKRVRSDDDD